MECLQPTAMIDSIYEGRPWQEQPSEAVEAHSLARNNASFAESFYGVARQHTGRAPSTLSQLLLLLLLPLHVSSLISPHLH